MDGLEEGELPHGGRRDDRLEREKQKAREESDAQLREYMSMSAKMEAAERPLDKLWKAIDSGATDFATWTKLLSTADSERSIEDIRKAYDRFLTEFPLCYVYWKKYADHEVSKGTPQTTRAVYERGLTYGIPHSVDLWTYYCTYLIEKAGADADEIRGTFERGVAIVGTDYASHLLWDKYLEFETSRQEFNRVNHIFLRIFYYPLEQIKSYWQRYQAFIAGHPADSLALHDELEQFRELHLDSDDQKKSWILAQREKIYNPSAEAADARRPFEQEVLKISYFHVRPLDEHQLTAWENYLKFEEQQGDYTRVVKLYERCLISCCNYSKFWFSYIRYLESFGSSQANYQAEEVRHVFQRACGVFLKSRPDLHLEYALFEEQYNNVDAARAVYENFLKQFPSHIEGTLRYVGFERRQGNFTRCEELFQQAIAALTDASHKVFLYLQLARFYGQVYPTPDKSRQILVEATKLYPKSKDIWVAMVELEKKVPGPDLEIRINHIYQRAIHQAIALSNQDKASLLSDWIDFSMEHGFPTHRLRQLLQEHRDLSPHSEVQAYAGLKRPYDGTGYEPAPKASRTDAAPATTTAGYDSNASTTDYSNYYQGYYGSYDYSAYANYQPQAS